MRRFQDLVRTPARKASRFNGRCVQAAVEDVRCCLSANRGNTLVYIVMVMLIFAALGVTMLSLFSASTSSSATPNDDRRALYLKESGLRYAFSELRNMGFASYVLDALNTTTYSLNPEGNFTLNVFSPWFDSNETKSIPAGGDLNLKVPHGKLVSSWTSKNPNNIYVVNFDYIPDLKPRTARDLIQSWVPVNDTILRITIGGDIEISKGERACLASRPSYTQTGINSGGDLYVEENAKDFFPQFNGAININKIDYFYKELIDDPANGRAMLKTVSATGMPNPATATPFPLTVTYSEDASSYYTGDFVVLSPRNYLVIPTGTAGTVSVGGTLEDSLNIVDFSVLTPMSLRQDIDAKEFTSNLGQKKTATSLITANPTTDQTLVVAGATGFGAAWYSGDLTVGGNANFCQAGKCRFGQGIRVFFLLNHSGVDGDGLTFSLINADLNTASSVGGDSQLSELLAYAGDSRTTPNPSGPGDFLDGSGLGLRAPKMALEFDGKANNQNYSVCADNATANLNARNDPDLGTGSDMVQYVFWGSDSSINAPCRGNNKTYDDNRHEGINRLWVYNTGGVKATSPTVSADGTAVYVGRSSNDTQKDAGRLIKVNASDGSLAWSQNPDQDFSNNDDDVESSPVISSTGFIYIGSDADSLPSPLQGMVAKFNSSGTRLSSIVLADGDIKTTLAVSNAKPGLYDGNPRVYASSVFGSLFGLVDGGGFFGGAWTQVTVGAHFSSPVIRYDAGSNKNFIYIGTETNGLYIIRDNGSSSSTAQFVPSPSGAIRTTPAVNPVTGDVYFGSDNNRIYAVTGTGTAKGGFPSILTGGPVRSSPAVTTDGRTIYAGSDDGRLYKISVTAAGAWVQTQQYPPVGQTALGAIRGAPAIASNGVVFFGSEDGHLYALGSDGTIWKYPATGSIAAVRSKPAIGPNGVVYFTAEDAKLYAVEFSVNTPPSRPDRYLAPINLGAVITTNWLTDGPWAVRLEVQRSLTKNASNNYEYTLKTWMKKCQDAGCTNAVGKYFGNTRFNYDWAAAGISPMAQTIELSDESPDFLNTSFNRFLYGFTTATSAAQTSTISKFQLSFIRPGDPLASD